MTRKSFLLVPACTVFVLLLMGVHHTPATIEPFTEEEARQVFPGRLSRQVSIGPETRELLRNYHLLQERTRGVTTSVSVDLLVQLMFLNGSICEELRSTRDPIVRFQVDAMLTGNGDAEAATRLFAAIHSRFLWKTDKRIIRTLCDSAGIRGKSDDKTAVIHRMIASYGDEPVIQPSERAPDFAVTTISGETYASNDMEDKVIVLHFWSSWCGPCIAQLESHIESLRWTTRRSDVLVLFISLDTDLLACERTVAEHEIPFHCVCDTHGYLGQLPRLFHVGRVPTDVIVDRDGSIAAYSIKELRRIVH